MALYVKAKILPHDCKTLYKYCLNIPNALNNLDYHISLFQSVENAVPYQPSKLKNPIVVLPCSWHIFKKEDINMLVLQIDSQELFHLHEKIKKETKLTYCFNNYKPHITISYSVPKDFVFPPLPSLKLTIIDQEVAIFNQDFGSSSRNDIPSKA